jgi:hypothetical protein
MLNKFNFINIIAAAFAGITGGLYIYFIFPGYFSHPVSSSILFAIILFMICFFAGRIKRSTWAILDNKWFYIFESLIVVIIVVLSYLYGYRNYANEAGILLLGYLIIYHSRTVRENIIKFVLLLVSPIFYYGIVFGGGFFTETIFAVSFLLLMDKMFDRNKIDYNFILSAAVSGFLVLLNPFLSVLFLTFCAYKFRQDLIRGTVFIFAWGLSVYILNVLLNAQVKFFPYDGFSLSAWFILLTIILAVISLYSGWISRSIYEVFFTAGMFIFVTIIICLSSFNYYFPQILSAAYPLFIVAIRDFRSQKYTGKITDD